MIDVQKRGKSREPINNLNLVPFIDLFSSLILFLMATAVFNKLASVPVNMGSTEQSKVQVPNGAPQGKKITSTVLVKIGSDSITLSDSGVSKTLNLETVSRNSYQEVTEFMRQARAKHQELREVVIDSTDKAKYGDLVAVMDEALAVNFDQLVVTGQGDK